MSEKQLLFVEAANWAKENGLEQHKDRQYTVKAPGKLRRYGRLGALGGGTIGWLAIGSNPKYSFAAKLGAIAFGAVGGYGFGYACYKVHMKRTVKTADTPIMAFARNLNGFPAQANDELYLKMFEPFFESRAGAKAPE